MILSFKHFEIQGDRLLYNGNEQITGLSADLYKLNYNFIFVNSKFKGEFDIKFESKKIILKGCSFEGDIEFSGNKNIFKIESFNSNFTINEPESDVTIKSTNIDGLGKIKDISSFQLSIEIYYLSDLVIENVKSENISIQSNITQEKPLNLDIYVENSGTFTILDVYINTINYNNSIFEKFVFDTCTFKHPNKYFNFLMPLAKSLIIRNIKSNFETINLCVDDFDLYDLLREIELKDIECELLILDFKQHIPLAFERILFSSDNRFVIETHNACGMLSVQNLELSGYFSKQNIIKDIEIKNLKFDFFQTDSEFIFRNLSFIEKGELVIGNSNLNNVTFNPSILHEFNKITTFGSDFFGMNITGFKFLNINHFAKEYIDINKRLFPTNNIKLFRYLKNFSLADGDLDSFQKYRSYELNETYFHSRQLKRYEKFILWFNKITNNHTTDWFKAFKLILITFSFYLYLITSYLLYSQNDFQFMDVSKILPNLLSPVSFLINNDEFCFPNLIYFFDVFYNIIIGLLLYQMIAAFRKFNR
ncbi:hypothetical protein [Cyclobacterium plantarum]|uniref:Pentapeptide repeat-containing protein n=1 Tax=Cyclobacterium plantarum TaxID=2716263 RepID=A0ABX0H7T1_9BACT|nr:hypothetical protein [Cyclobacterium plantarum]NHE57944.1 hypothetical protein [Cyclobacterium plantarum]